MAKMIPQDVTHLPAKTTRGEKALYRIIKKHTPDNWICYACQRLNVGTTPDFVIIGPELGLLVLEEKSIPLNLIKELTTETWTVVRDGTPEKEPHPLRQARGYAEKAAQEMKKQRRLTDNDGRLKFVYGHGVVLSSLSRHELVQSSLSLPTPPIATFEPQLVIASNELPNKGQKESDFAKRLLKMNQLFRFDDLDDKDIQTIRGALFPEVRARILADEMTDRNVGLETLTVEQEQMARGIGQNDKIPHRRLNGVSGSGKSIILRVRATDVATANPDWKILLTFFTRSLRNYLGKNLPRNIDVMTIGQSIYSHWKSHNLPDDDFDAKSEAGWESMTQRLRENNLSRAVYQAIFLDESPDLTAPQADYLRHLLSEDTDCAFFCGDDVQNIFGKKKLNWKEHGFRFKGRTSTMELSCNFRNTKQIFDFGYEFIKDQHDALSSDGNDLSEDPAHPYKNVECKRNGPKPLLKEYASTEDEQLTIIKEINRLIKVEKVPPGSIAILHPYATLKYQDLIDPYLQNLKHEGIPVHWLTKDDRSKSDYDPDNNTLTISTPFSGKGLEWDIVFMASINHYYGDNPDSLRAVAAWRARHILYPSIIQDN